MIAKEMQKHAERDIAAHVLAIRDIARDYDILEGETDVSISIFRDCVSFFALNDNGEKVLDYFQRIAEAE
jgi:hypothetical protein